MRVVTRLVSTSGGAVKTAKNGRAVAASALWNRHQKWPSQWVRGASSNKPGGIFSDLLEKEEKAHASLVGEIGNADKSTPPPPPGPGATEEEQDAMATKLCAAAEAANARKAVAAAAKAAAAAEEGDATGQEAQANDARSSSPSPSRGGRGAERSPGPTEAEAEKFDLLDEDLQEIIRGWEVWDGKPVRLGAVLADNMIFDVEELRNTTAETRAELEGIDRRDQEAIELWLHPEKAASSSDDGAAATDSIDDAGDTPKKLDWAAMATQARGFLHSAWGEVKESAVEIFKIDKDESVLKKRVHVSFTLSPRRGAHAVVYFQCPWWCDVIINPSCHPLIRFCTKPPPLIHLFSIMLATTRYSGRRAAAASVRWGRGQQRVRLVGAEL